jgi:hypothetical protein
MKKIFTLLIGIVFSITVLYSQEAPPQAFSFKATIKDKYGLPVLLKKINLRITILQGDMNGPAVYSEYFTPTTNLYSQVDVEIGKGNVLSGIFTSIDWSTNEYFLKIEADVKGGSNYQLLSVTQLLSVPYALYAGKAGSAINESDPIFKTYPAYGIKNGDISNWDAAYSWGNHAGLYKPLNYLPAWSEIANKPTTIAGFGITDAVTTMGDQTIAGNKTFTGTTTVSNALNAGNGFGSIYSETEKRPILGQRGNVSIGTASNWDWSELDVNGGVNILPGQWDWGSGLALSAWAAQGGGGEQYLIGSTGALAHEGPGKFFIRNTNHYWDAIFIMDNQGRVGIDMGFDGLPQYTLDVMGDINFTGELFKNGSPYSTGFLTNETDPIFTSHAANGITATNITNWNNAYSWGNHAGLYRPIGYMPTWSEITSKPNFATVATSGSYNDLNNKPTIDGSETKLTEGTNVTVTGAGTVASPYVINSTGGGSSSHYIGESYGSGIIFYLDASGQHGLIAATTDQSTAIQWNNGSNTNTTAFASSVGGGDGNTSMIVFNQGAGTYAAKLCRDLYTGGFFNWYLPSKYELNLMYHNIGQGNLLGLGNVGGFANNAYWSSTEATNINAWLQFFDDGSQNFSYKYLVCYVRAVRAF